LHSKSPAQRRNAKARLCPIEGFNKPMGLSEIGRVCVSSVVQKCDSVSGDGQPFFLPQFLFPLHFDSTLC
jgi:hypothetical protein